MLAGCRNGPRRRRPSALVRRRIHVPALTAAAGPRRAVCLFLGVVRDLNRGRAVLALEYEAYEGWRCR